MLVLAWRADAAPARGAGPRLGDSESALSDGRLDSAARRGSAVITPVSLTRAPTTKPLRSPRSAPTKLPAPLKSAPRRADGRGVGDAVDGRWGGERRCDDHGIDGDGGPCGDGGADGERETVSSAWPSCGATCEMCLIRW